MNYKILLLLITFTNVIYAQKVKKIKKNVGFAKAIYYVLKSDVKTKHGKYIEQTYSGKDNLIEGQYVYGKKEGIWFEKHRKGRKLKSKGKYFNDKRIGDWIFYNPKGDSTQIYDFTKKRLKWSNDCQDKKYTIILNNKILDTVLDCKPMYLGGINTFFSGFSDYFMFKYFAEKSDVLEFDNTILITIDTNDRVSDIKFKKEVLSKKLKKRLIEYINLNNNNWITGILNGEKVKTILDLKMKFKFRTHI